MTTRLESQFDLTESISDQRRYGERLIRFAERSRSAPLTENQFQILVTNVERLTSLGLSLEQDLSGIRWLQSTDRVGMVSLVTDGKTLLIQVTAKIADADLFRMVDRTFGRLPVQDEDAEAQVRQSSLSGVFLRYWTAQILAFLQKGTFRDFHYRDRWESGRIRGKPLLREYVRYSVPRAKQQVVPTRSIEFDTNVVENQIIAYTVTIAMALVVQFDLQNSKQILSDLRKAMSYLTGVSTDRISKNSIQNLRYRRNTERFRPVHELCRYLLEGSSISLDSGRRIQFASFNLHMPTLFQRYVTSLFKTVFGSRHVGDRRSLTFATGFGGRPIVLDGLIRNGNRAVVVEAKYRSIKRVDEELVLGQVPESHVYQTVAYMGHVDVRASEGIIVYPIWEEGPPIVLTLPVTDFGWSQRQSSQGKQIRLLGIDLSASYQDVTREMSLQLGDLIS